MNMKSIYEATKKNQQVQQELNHEEEVEKGTKMTKPIEQIVSQKQLEHSIYPNVHDDYTTDLDDTKNVDDMNSFKPVKMQSIESDVNIVNDPGRIIKPSAGISSDQLHEYVPATKIKGERLECNWIIKMTCPNNCCFNTSFRHGWLCIGVGTFWILH